MTENKQFKKEVREYARKHGLAYADARRRVLAEREDESLRGNTSAEATSRG